MNRRNYNKINNNFKFNNNLKFGITTLIILTPVGFICRKQLKEIMNIGYMWCIKTLENDISNKNLNILGRWPRHRVSPPGLENKKRKFIIYREFLIETGVWCTLLEKILKKNLPKYSKYILKFLKK
jgi:hypothetical protein